MKTADAISEILKREGVEWVIGYPVNHILERAAAADIRPIIVRQERTGCTWPRPSRASRAARSSASSPCSTAPAPRTPTAAWRRPIASPCRSWSCPWAMRGARPGWGATTSPASAWRASPSRQSRSPRPRRSLRSSAALSRSCARAAAARCWWRCRSTSGTRRSTRSTTCRSPLCAGVPTRKRCARLRPC